MRPLTLAFSTLLVFTACQSPPKQVDPSLDDFAIALSPGEFGLSRLDPTQVPDFSVGWYERDDLAESTLNSLSYLAAPSSHEFFPHGPVTHEHMQASLERFLKLLETSSSAEEFGSSVHEEFEVWMARGRENTGEVLFTGYCTPILKGSRTRGGEFLYPLYSLPNNLVKGVDRNNTSMRKNLAGDLVPYWSAHEIESQKLLKGQELLWLNNPFDAYIARIQGSALIEFQDGSRMEVGYAGTNGHDYKSIGGVLVQEGKIQKGELSLTRLRDYFERHPQEADRVLNQNPRYTFFMASEGGPYGCLGRPVLAKRSIATDKDVFPRAGIVFCEVRLPDYDENKKLIQRPMRFFALDQDRGGAIRSAGRCDVFLGVGPEAVNRAGHVLSVGRMYYLLLRDPRPGNLALSN